MQILVDFLVFLGCASLIGFIWFGMAVAYDAWQERCRKMGKKSSICCCDAVNDCGCEFAEKPKDQSREEREDG